MREILIIVMGIFMSPSVMEVPNAFFQEKRQVLLEAHYSSKGMLSWRDGDHLIAKIYSDGIVEYEDVEIRNGVSISSLRRATLSKEELSDLSEFLKSNDVQGLSNEYAAFSTTIDHSEDLILKIRNGSQFKEIKVENFKPDLPEISVKYPKALVRVACWAEFARKNAQVRFFLRESPLCCKCP